MVAPLLSSSLLVLVVAAVFWDLYQRRIPNYLIMAGAAIGILLQAVLAGSGGVLAAILGLLVGLVILLPGYLLGVTGAGDAKLMAAVGTFLGPLGVFQAALASILVGGIIAIGVAVGAFFSSQSISPWGRYNLMFRSLIIAGKPIYISPEKGEVMGRKFPFAVFIALGTIIWLAWQWSQV